MFLVVLNHLLGDHISPGFHSCTQMFHSGIQLVGICFHETSQRGDVEIIEMDTASSIDKTSTLNAICHQDGEFSSLYRGMMRVV
jgi:hypothetical protein